MRKFVVGLLWVMMSGCENVVSVSVPDSAQRLVIEARLERIRGAVSGEQRVRLTTTSRYFDTIAPPPARGAIVRVVTEAGLVVPFSELSAEPGVYQTSALTIAVGTTYTLRITFNGQEYTATDKAMSGVPIDSLHFEGQVGNTGFLMARAGNAGPKEGLRATIALRDPIGVRNYYLWDQFTDGVRHVSPDTVYYRAIAEDDLADGLAISRFQPYNGIVVRSGQLVKVRQISLSAQAYRYYFALSEQTANNGSPFGVPASNLRGNIANLTNPANIGLGYFFVSEVSEIERRVP